MNGCVELIEKLFQTESERIMANIEKENKSEMDAYLKHEALTNSRWQYIYGPMFEAVKDLKFAEVQE